MNGKHLITTLIFELVEYLEILNIYLKMKKNYHNFSNLVAKFFSILNSPAVNRRMGEG